MNTANPKLVLVRGLPGSGKSYLVAALKDSIGQDEVVVLDPDATDYTSQAYSDFSAKLTADGVESKFHPYRFLRAGAYAGITAHKVIIWNQAFTSLDGFQKTVVNLQTYAADHDTKLAVLVVEVEVPEAVAKQRIADREKQGGHGVSEAAFARFVSDYVSFAGQGYEILRVDGEDDVAVSVKAVMAALKNLT